MSSQTRFSVENLETRTLLAADLGLDPQGVDVEPTEGAQPYHDGPIVCFDWDFSMPFDVVDDASATTTNPPLDQPPTSGIDPLGLESSSSTTDVSDPTQANDDDSLTPIDPDDATSSTDASDPIQADNDDSITPWGIDVDVHGTEFGGEPDRITAVDEVLAAYGSTDR